MKPLIISFLLLVATSGWGLSQDAQPQPAKATEIDDLAAPLPQPEPVSEPSLESGFLEPALPTLDLIELPSAQTAPMPSSPATGTWDHLLVQPPTVAARPPIWEAILPGGSFAVAVTDIVSISQHTYVIADEACVLEVTVATRGSITARFLHRAPLPVTPSAAEEVSPLVEGQRALKRAQTLMATGRHLSDPEDGSAHLPVKRPEEASRGNTVTYLLASKDDLIALYENARECWREGKSGSFQWIPPGD